MIMADIYIPIDLEIVMTTISMGLVLPILCYLPERSLD
jgi:hypothetical protein